MYTNVPFRGRRMAFTETQLLRLALSSYEVAAKPDFRYQLTVMGEFAQAIVARRISHNQFVIRTSKPSVEVSWQVTGVRHDAYAQAHRIMVEQEKPEPERGHYLYPDLFGKSSGKIVAGVGETNHKEGAAGRTR